MVFLSWGRPSPKDQKACINKSGTFNYDGKYKGFTAKSISSLEQDEGLSKDGFSLNNKRVLLGSGAEVFENAKIALKSWRHFGLDWTFVDPKTQIKQGEKFCVCVKEFLPWVMMPLQVVYVNESSAAKRKRVASFGFGSGTLHGHLLQKSAFRSRSMRTIKCGMKYFPSRNLHTFYHLLQHHMLNFGKNILLMNLPR
ncbi:hypothetical protein AAHE18_13G003300 [Arachis hypogaea]